MTAFWALTLKEALHILRDRRSLGVALALPLLLIVLFGTAIRFDVRAVELAVVDQDRSPASRALVQVLAADGVVRVVARPDRAEALDGLLAAGQARVGLVLPPGLDRELDGEASVPILLVVDGTDATFASQALARVGGALAEHTRRDLLARLQLPELPGLVPVPRVLYNPALDGTWFVIPGLIAVIVALLAAMLTSQCVAREYEQGTIEQILVSPVGGLPLMLAKLLPYVALGLVQVASVTLASWGVFGVPLRGSLVLYAGATSLYLLGSMAFGVMISATLKSQQIALQVSVIATLLPSLLLSGFIFPIHTMPLPLQAVSYAIPARYFVAVSRGLFLKGSGLAELWPELVAMGGYAAVMLLLAASRFRRSLA